MKVLFVINISDTKTAKPRVPPTGIAYLGAYLKKEGHQVAVYDCAVEDNNLFNQWLLSYDIVGVSLYSLNINSSYLFINKIVAYLKQNSDKKIPVILGGPHITVTMKEALMKSDADFAIQGEGELTLLELLTSLSKAEDTISQIKGLIWRNEKGLVVENPLREFIEDIDSLPFPDYSFFKQDKYKSYELNEISLSTSRGCPFDCLFCAVKLVAGKRFRGRTPENVFREIVARYNNGIRSFYVTDDAFNLDIKRAEEICELIIRNNLKIKLAFQNGLRVDRLTPELVEKLSRAGCRVMMLSAEAGNNDVLQSIKKKITVEKVMQAVNIVDKANINFVVNFIIGHPTETYDKAMDSIRLARKIAKKKSCVTIMFLNLIPYPQTEVYKWVEKNGKWLLPKESFLDSSTLDLSPVFESENFTRKERVAVLKKGNKIHRALLLKFIFGKYAGFLSYLITKIPVIRRLMYKLSFSSKLGNNFIYSRFLKKLYSS